MFSYLKIDSLMQNETNTEVIKKAKILKYKYKEMLVNAGPTKSENSVTIST